MIANRQFDTKNQYSLNRNHPYRYKKGDSISTAGNNIKIKKPLGDSVSFKGFPILSLKDLKSYFVPITNEIPAALTKKVFNTLFDLSDNQFKYYNQIRKTYVDTIKKDPVFRKKYGITKEVAENITTENLYCMPKQQAPVRFLTNLVSPLKFVYDKVYNFVVNKESKSYKQNAYYEKIAGEYKSLEGLIRSVKIWENGYRRLTGNKIWDDKEEFIIPTEILHGKINRRRNKVLDPHKGKYSTTSLMLGNRFISGSVYAYFLGNDAYNTTIRYSNDKNQAASERKSRVAQEFSRVGLNMYIQNLLFGTFETAVNKSLTTALTVSGATTAFSEILGRQLVGKPIVPADKATLDKMEADMRSRNGILPAIGRLLTGAKKIPQQKTSNTIQIENKPNNKLFASFAPDQKNGSKIPSFKGFFWYDRIFQRQQLLGLINVIEQADKKQAYAFKKIVAKGIKASEMFDKHSSLQKNYTELFVPKDNRSQTVEEFLDAFDKYMDVIGDNIPVGIIKTPHGQIVKSFLVPFKFLRENLEKLSNFIEISYNVMRNKESKCRVNIANRKLSNTNSKKTEDFHDYFNRLVVDPAWKKARYGTDMKRAKLYGEFLIQRKKDAEDVEGIKNILLWLEQQINNKNIRVLSDGTLHPEDVEKLRAILKRSVLKADSSKHVEYDGNTLTQTNINLARAITTIFLVTDAYNLTMQYSNDNKKAAQKSAKNRTAQEISRIGLSAYMLAFVHNLLAKMCNSSLAGAFGLTALTSVINDSASRVVVGVPLTPKTRDQLLALDQKNTNSKSPIRKALAYSIGKKSSAKQTKKDQNNNFLSDFYITPTIK